jgi:CRISPR/Cas system-associated protein Csm6
MIDNEQIVFDTVAKTLRAKYKNIYIVGDELTTAPNTFPAVVLRKSNSSINKRYSTFDKREVSVTETYYCTIYSNLDKGKTTQCKEIAYVINEVMDELFYARIYEEQLFNADASIGRRVLKYSKSNVV